MDTFTTEQDLRREAIRRHCKANGRVTFVEIWGAVRVGSTSGGPSTTAIPTPILPIARARRIHRLIRHPRRLSRPS